MRTSLIAVLALVPAALAAQQHPQTAPLVLRLPGGTRAMGLGNAFAAGRGTEVLFYNPAQLWNGRGSVVSVARFSGAATAASLATAGPFGKIAIGAGVQYLDYRTPPGQVFTSPGELVAGGPVRSTSLVGTIAVAGRVKGVRVGLSGKYVQERFSGAVGDGLALDIGAAREFGRTTFALTVQNLGGSLNLASAEANLPARVTAGVMSPTIRLGTYFDLIAAGSISRERDGRIIPAGGVELVHNPLEGFNVVLRAGGRRVETGSTPQEFPATAGASIGYDRLWVDYAFQPSRDGGGAVHRVGIRIQ